MGAWLHEYFVAMNITLGCYLVAMSIWLFGVSTLGCCGHCISGWFILVTMHCYELLSTRVHLVARDIALVVMG